MLLYIRNRIVKPFHKIFDMPVELSKGHLQGELPEYREKYFGQFVWGISMLRDKLEYQKNKELKLKKDKKMLLLSISHDMKTPLNNIRLYTRALQDHIYEQEEQQTKALLQIDANAVKIETFIAEVIRTSSEDVIEIDVNNSEFYLSELITLIKNIYYEKMKIRNLEFVIEKYDNKLLYGDIDRSLEVCENIIENAIKYGDGQKVIFSFPTEEYHQLLTIYNSGDTVPQSEMNHLFDSFFRGSNTGGKPGNGLGLYICREIMHKMDGDIFASSQENGMSFTLVFR